MRITPATAEDIPALAQLLGILFSQEQEFVPDARLQEKGLAAILANPANGVIFVARDKDRILGMANLIYNISTALGGPVGTVEDVIVHPDFRGRGVGSAIIRKALDHADSTGLLRISLLADLSNERALKFYHSLGFTRSDMLTLRRFPA
ncbi:MAG: GNAT family N-acetyltransferase [Verrucomicrobiota bacterium JB025]|nr:GNAT family N-acetyltransferase [Verrucomicrobiota bacterium JB025]